MAHGRTFRILEIRTELLPEMLKAGFNAIFVVEPAQETTEPLDCITTIAGLQAALYAPRVA